MDRIYLKEILKRIFRIIVVVGAILAVLWCVIFAVDYVLYKNSKQTIFTITKIENEKEGYTTIQKGLGYKYVIENENTKLFVFGKEIK